MLREIPELAREWERRDWAKGLAKGIEEGMAHEKSLLLRQIQHRFGNQAAQTAQDIIIPIFSIETLEQIGDWIVDCEDYASFLKAIYALVE